VVAHVGARIVTVDHVERLLEETKRSFELKGRPFPKIGEPYYLYLRDQAVGYLVWSAASDQEAKRLGVEVSAAEVERQIADVDRRDLEEQMRHTGLTLDRVREDVRADLVDRGIFKAVVAAKPDGEKVDQAMERWQSGVDGIVAHADYEPGWKPAEKPRSSIPPELQKLPKPKASCDLKEGTFTFREWWAHGCAEGVPLPGITGPGCGDVPIDDFVTQGFSSDDLESGYADWQTDDNAPVCSPYPASKFSVHTVENAPGGCLPSRINAPCPPGPETIIEAGS
jgi:hypothetical protein